MSEARADLPAAGAGAAAMNLKPALPTPSGQTPDTVLPSPSVGAAPQAQARPIPTQDAADAGLPPELQGLDPVADKIKSKENPTGDPTLISGGGHFGYPQGVKVGAGTYQDLGTTWEKHIAPEVQQKYGRTLDFNNPADQEFGNRYWMAKTYGVDDKGRTLQEAVKANEVDYKRLSDQWIGLKTGPSLRDQMMGSVPNPMAGHLAQLQAQIGQHAEQDRATYDRMASQPLPGAKERGEMLDEARGRSREARDLYSQLGRNPPVEKPIDALQNFGSVGTMLALLIGGMGRHHMNGALMAAGGMMQAAQANNHEQFERQYKIWDHQSSIALNLASLENQQIRDLMEDRRATQAERDANLNNFYREHGMSVQAEQSQAGLAMENARLLQHSEDARHSAAQLKYQTGLMFFNAWHGAHPEAPDDQVAEKAKFFGVIPPGGMSPTPKTAQMIEVPDPSDPSGKKKKAPIAAHEIAPGKWVDASNNQPIDTSGGVTILGRAGTGAQAATQVMAMIGSANEVLPALRNLVSLPVTATMGVFMGLQSQRPDTLSEALKRSSVNHITSDEAKAIQTRLAGVGRAMATLEAQGRATGLVGLQTMNEASLTPAAGDDGISVMGKYAEMRQIVEQNVETVMTSRYTSPEQKELLQKIQLQIKEAVPWTVQDVNELIWGQQTGNVESVKQFADRVLAERKGKSGSAETTALPPGIPEGSVKAGTVDGHPAYRAPDGSLYQDKP